jgi:hypothetical protein
MNQRQPNNAPPSGSNTNWPLIFCLFSGLPLELVLHDVRTFGVRSVGPRAGGAALVMFVFVCCHPHDDQRPLTCFMIAAIVLSIVAQIIASIRYYRGGRELSRYNGTPYAVWLFPRSEVAIKRLEPVVALLIGGAIHHFNHPLGAFLITAAFCQGIRVGLDRIGRRTRDLDMNDALVEQQMAMEDVRGVPGR